MDILSPHCIVVIEKRRFDSWEGKSLISASVNITADRSGEGILRLYDPDYKIIDSLLGNGISTLTAKFYFGWGMSLTADRVYFLGNLVQTEWDNNITTLRFHDNSLKMKQEMKTRYHKKKTDLQILRSIATEHGLKFEVPPSFPESHPFVSLVQMTTDWRFALSIAKRAGLVLYVGDETLYATEAGITQNKPSIPMINGKDFQILRGLGLTYKLPKHPKSRIKKMEVRGQSGNSKRLAVSEGTGDDGISRIDFSETPSFSLSNASRQAKAIVRRQREHTFEHTIKTLFSFRKIISIRDVVHLANVGKFYSGKYFVSSVDYTFEAGKLYCELKVAGDVVSLAPKPKEKFTIYGKRK